MKSSNGVRKGFVRGLIGVVALSVMTMTVGQETALAKIKRPKQGGSVLAAYLMLKSCRAEAREEYYNALANVAMIPDKEARVEAREEAEEELEEHLEECVEQYRARRELVRELGETRYFVEIDPANFNAPGVNDYWPMTPGTVRTYEGETEDGTETVVITVMDETREILGVECQVVRDVAYLDGEPIEDTLDYFAIDNGGNVWYFGENSVEIEDGLIVDTEGSWIAGEDGAQPGIVMPANPQPGDAYRQEYLAGEAEDAARVISLTEDVVVSYGSFSNYLLTEDFTPIEPDTLEEKYYAPGVGVIYEVDTESGELLELISITTL